MGHEVTIITLSRNVDYFNALLHALSEQTGDLPSYLGVLVNNAQDGELTSSAMKAQWATIEPGYNTSYSVGNNLAARAVPGCEWFLFLNDDAVPEPTWLSELWKQRHRADVVGSLLLHEDGTVNHAGTKVAHTCHSDHIGRDQPRFKFTGFAYTPAVTFAAVLVRAEKFRRLGGLSSQYVYGSEDTDFCLKVINDGGTVGCARDAVAVHGECGTRPRGGEADEHNGRQFIQEWHTRLRDVLESYAARMQPEVVEGVKWLD